MEIFSDYSFQANLTRRVKRDRGQLLVLILQPEKGISFMAKIQLFLQFEGERRIELIELDDDALGSDIIQAALRAGLDAAHAHGTHVFGPDDDSPLKPDVPLDKQGICDK